MAQYDNTNRGTLFVNDRKAPGSNQPDRSGTLNVEGVEYFFDGWLKKSAAGASFLSVSIKRKDKQPGSAPAQQQQPQQSHGYGQPTPQAAHAPAASFSDADADIPF